MLRLRGVQPWPGVGLGKANARVNISKPVRKTLNHERVCFRATIPGRGSCSTSRSDLQDPRGDKTPIVHTGIAYTENGEPSGRVRSVRHLYFVDQNTSRAHAS